MSKKSKVQGWLHIIAIVASAVTSALAASNGIATPEVGAVIGGAANTFVATISRNF